VMAEEACVVKISGPCNYPLFVDGVASTYDWADYTATILGDDVDTATASPWHRAGTEWYGEQLVDLPLRRGPSFIQVHSPRHCRYCGMPVKHDRLTCPHCGGGMA